MGQAVIVIEPMVESDVEAVAALEAASQPTPWSEQVIRDELGGLSRIYLVARAPEVVGFGGVIVVADEAHVTNLLVDPAKRNQGLGRRLVIALVEKAIDLGARHLTLEVRSKNDSARRLYASLGLAPVGVRPGYYDDDDALIMWAHDVDDPAYLEGLR